MPAKYTQRAGTCGRRFKYFLGNTMFQNLDGFIQEVIRTFDFTDVTRNNCLIPKTGATIRDQEAKPKFHLPFSKLLTNSIKLRTPIPDGPLAIQLLFSSIHAVPAMSRCSQGLSSTNSFRKTAAVLAPPQRPPVFIISAILERIWSRYS